MNSEKAPYVYTPDMKPDLTAIDLGSIIWQTSSYSNGSGGMCVQVARLDDGGVLLRDKKDPQGPVLAFSENEFRAFKLGVVAGEFGDNRPPVV